MYKAYILTIEKSGGVFDSFNYETFHGTLTTAAGVVDWWHHLNGVYILIVNANSTALSITNYIMKIAPNKKFFVTHIDLKDHSGWLMPDAWTWINKYMNTTR